MSRNMHGEGSVYRRKDGRWAGSTFVTTAAGRRKRIYVYGRTRADVHTKLTDTLHREQQGVPVPERTWRLGDYLDYYLKEVAAATLRPSTLDDYDRITQAHLKPSLGHHALKRLSARHVQEMLNAKAGSGTTPRRLHAIRDYLRSVLSHAEREELVVRNVAKLVKVASYEPKSNEPWTPDEAHRFLVAAKDHRWYGVFILTLVYGMRRGEAIGLTWDNVDLEHGTFWVRQQLQAVSSGLRLGSVKTRAGNRPLPVVNMLREVIEAVPRQDAATSWNLVFTSSTGTPITPRNVGREFQKIREAAGLRRIRLHDGRHTSATILKDLGVPDRDIQKILGHAHVSTTQQLYQHGSIEVQREGLQKLERAVMGASAAVKSDVNKLFPVGQSANNRALTSGTPGTIRTYDTWFRRLIRDTFETEPISVVRQVRTRVYAPMCGHVAVKMCCQNPALDTAENIEYLIHLARAMRQVHYAHLSHQAFPFSLLPPTPPPR